MTTLERFELFEELVDDVKMLLVEQHLSPLTNLMLALTSKRYLALVGAEIRGLLSLDELSRELGKVGSKELFLFYYDDLDWRCFLDIVLESAIASAQVDFLRLFEWDRASGFSFRDAERAHFQPSLLSYVIGLSCSQDVENFFFNNGDGFSFLVSYYLNGVACAGNLERLKAKVDSLPFTLEMAESLVICALEKMYVDILDWFIAEKGVTFVQSDAPGVFYINPKNVFFVEMRYEASAPTPHLYMRGISYLEKHKADLSGDPIMQECLYGNALDACLYLENKYGSLQRLSGIESSDICSLLKRGAYETLRLLLSQRPDLINEYARLRFYQHVILVLFNHRFAKNERELKKKVHQKHYRNLLSLLLLAEEKLESEDLPPVELGSDNENMALWKSVIRGVLDSEECNEFIECLHIYLPHVKGLPSEFFDLFEDARKSNRVSYPRLEDFYSLLHSAKNHPL